MSYSFTLPFHYFLTALSAMDHRPSLSKSKTSILVCITAVKVLYLSLTIPFSLQEIFVYVSSTVLCSALLPLP